MTPSAPAADRDVLGADAVPLGERPAQAVDAAVRVAVQLRQRRARAPRAPPGTARTGPSFDASLTTRSSPSSRCTSSTGLPGSYGTSSSSAGRKKDREPDELRSAHVEPALAVDEIGLFPLELVLLPGEQVPLHIFEPRYRELIGECLDDGREFGLVLADERRHARGRHAARRRRGARALRRRAAERRRRGPRALPARRADRGPLVPDGRGRAASPDEPDAPDEDEIEDVPRRLRARRRPPRRPSSTSLDLRRGLALVRDRRPRRLRHRGQAGAARAALGARARDPARADARPGAPTRSRCAPDGHASARPATAASSRPGRPRQAGRLDAVDRTAGRLPQVVRGARAERGLVLDDARVAADLLRPLGVAEQVRVVALLPDEDEVRGGHELGDEGAAGGGTRERVGADAEPAGVVGAGVVGPELLLLEASSRPRRGRSRLACGGAGLGHPIKLLRHQDRVDVAVRRAGSGRGGSPRARSRGARRARSRARCAGRRAARACGRRPRAPSPRPPRAAPGRSPWRRCRRATISPRSATCRLAGCGSRAIESRPTIPSVGLGDEDRGVRVRGAPPAGSAARRRRERQLAVGDQPALRLGADGLGELDERARRRRGSAGADRTAHVARRRRRAPPRRGSPAASSAPSGADRDGRRRRRSRGSGRRQRTTS